MIKTIMTAAILVLTATSSSALTLSCKGSTDITIYKCNDTTECNRSTEIASDKLKDEGILTITPDDGFKFDGEYVYSYTHGGQVYNDYQSYNTTVSETEYSSYFRQKATLSWDHDALDVKNTNQFSIDRFSAEATIRNNRYESGYYADGQWVFEQLNVSTNEADVYRVDTRFNGKCKPAKAAF